MSNEFARLWAEAESIDSREINNRANVMAANKVGLIGPNPPGFDYDQAVAEHTGNLFMIAAFIYRTTQPDKTTDDAIDFIMSDDFLYGAVGCDLVESGYSAASGVTELVNGLRRYLVGVSPSIEDTVDNPEALRDFKNGYFAACQLANEQGCPFGDVFMNPDLYEILYCRLESDAIFEQF